MWGRLRDGGTATMTTALFDLIVLLPPIVLALLVLRIVWAKHRRARGALPGPPGLASEPHRIIAEKTADLAPRPSAEPPTPIESVETLLAKIDQATANGEKTSLSGLYYNLAAAYDRAGNTAARMSALRSAAGNGALHGPPSAHAAARLALGETAYEAGDLTSACEQWQMARAAYLEGGDHVQHERVEKRMRDNGCPTDWVLTDF